MQINQKTLKEIIPNLKEDDLRLLVDELIPMLTVTQIKKLAPMFDYQIVFTGSKTQHPEMDDKNTFENQVHDDVYDDELALPQELQ